MVVSGGLTVGRKKEIAMPHFSEQSRKKLDTCDVRLQHVFNEVIKYVDCTILEGHRSEARQRQLLREGKTKVEVSRHMATPSMAVDVAPYPINWGNSGNASERQAALWRFIHFGGFVTGLASQIGIPIRWGGDWNRNFKFGDQTFNDWVHFEIPKDADR